MAQRSSRWVSLLVGAAVLAVAAACGPTATAPVSTADRSHTVSAPFATPASPMPTARAPGPSPAASRVTGRYDIGGRSLYLACAGHGSPPVIFEAGLGGTSASWTTVLFSSRPVSRVCVYDRANLGSSDPAPTPRTTADVVEDLHALLATAGIEGPYVLVGHSFGGLAMRLFAATYPEDVAGLVLVDATPPELEDEIIPLAAPGERAALSRALRDNGEGLDIRASAAEVVGGGRLPDVPLVVISAVDGHCDVRPCAGLEAAWTRLQVEMADLAPSGRRVVARGSGHGVPDQRPDLIIEVVTEMLERIRAG
jgi:pimeloyl-ACP methyl ester carboxylesterase